MAIFNDPVITFNSSTDTFNSPGVTISNLSIGNYPNNIAGDSTPIFAWIQDGSPTLFELQISYNVNSFSIPLIDTTFQSTNSQYLLSPEFSLVNEGTYYARIRGYNISWGNWSSTLTFGLSLYPPTPPTISQVSSPANNFTQVINGFKLPGLYVFVSVNGGEYTEASYPNGIGAPNWSFTVPLSSGNNTIIVNTSFLESTNGALSADVSTSIFLATSTPSVYNVWNAFDEIGLLLSLQRNPGEKNLQYRSRLLDVYQNPGNSTYQGLVNGISRELGVDSNSLTVSALSDLMDPNNPDNLLNADGNAIGTPLEKYADEVYRNNPVFLGTVISDQSYWDGVTQSTNDYIFLPHLWDSSAVGVYAKWQAGGIGDHDDLWVSGPVEVYNSNLNTNSWYLQIHTGYFYSSNPWSLFAQPSGIVQIEPSGIYVEDDSGILVSDDSFNLVKDDGGQIL